MSISFDNFCLKSLSNDLQIAFENKQFCDVKIICGTEEFTCHKIILCARSKVFQAMFNSKMYEALNSVVHIEVSLLSENCKYQLNSFKFIFEI